MAQKIPRFLMTDPGSSRFFPKWSIQMMDTKDDLALNRAIINLAALRHNFREVKRRIQGSQIMAVVKDEAYGHGLLPAAKALVQAGADSLGADDVMEGMRLRSGGVTLPIHILGGFQGRGQAELAVSENLSVFVFTREQISALSAQATAQGQIARFHIFADTSLDSLGLNPDEIEDLLPELGKIPNVKYLGLATALNSFGDEKAHEQLRLFDHLCYRADAFGLPQDANSALCSAGILAHGNHMARLARPGQLLYGLQPGGGLNPAGLDLRPAMRVESCVLQIKIFPAGASLAGDASRPLTRESRVAIAPFGYGNGLLCSRANWGWALIGGRPAPLIGRMGMNKSMFDISDIPGVEAGDPVVILGRQISREIDAWQLAAWNRGNAKEALRLLGSMNTKVFEGSDYEIHDEA